SFTEQVEPVLVEDKWNYWVFRANANSYFGGEKSSNFINFYGNFSANRITPDWKTRLSTNYGYERSSFTYTIDDVDTTVISISRSRGFNGLIVKSLTDHWSAGISGSAYRSTYNNTDLGISIAPAIEYNLFPYSESTRRELLFLYKAGINPIRYEEETIYDKTSETLYRGSLSVALDQNQTWGSVSTTLEGSHYFHDFYKHRLTLFSELSLRLVKGFSLRLFGRASRIRDQLSIPKSERSPAEIFLKLKELETSYNYFGSIGLSYTFGSIYSNVVNPRFGNF
ncbi:hypothetical protein IIA15_03020, partial [candidate division TA06 bacterium]|nr:hypothetical protein [candidate division TA06 bacterium]